jgi:hypothetical protein
MAKEKPGGSGHNAAVLARLRAMRAPGKSCSDVIFRLVAAGRDIETTTVMTPER